MARKDPIDKDMKEIFTSSTEDSHEHGKHPNSLKNLQKWEKGQPSPNPIGRPFKYQLLKEKLNELGNEITYNYDEDPIGTRKEQLLKSIWAKAINGSIQHAKILIYLGVYDED